MNRNRNTSANFSTHEKLSKLRTELLSLRKTSLRFSQMFLNSFIVLTLFACFIPRPSNALTLIDFYNLKHALNIELQEVNKECQNKNPLCQNYQKNLKTNIEYYQQQFSIYNENQILNDHIAKEFLYEACTMEESAVAAPGKEFQLIRQSINALHDWLLADALTKTALTKRNPKNPTDNDQSDGVDGQIQRFIDRRQDNIIYQICTEIPPDQLNAAAPVSFQSLFTSPTLSSYALECLGKISALWENPAQLFSLLKLDPELAKIINSNHDFLLQSPLIFSFIKHSRATITKAYFSTRFLSELSANTGLTVDDLQKGLTGFGFNRLFSPQNRMGASGASDVDFKIVYDENYFKNKLQNPISLRNIIEKTLLSSQKDFKDHLGITMEVEKFTIKEIGEINSIIDTKNEKELNFFASTLNNNSPLFGSPTLRDSIFNSMGKAIGPHAAQRTYTQYVTPSTDKGSIQAIASINELKQIPPESALYNQSKKVISQFQGPFIGKPGTTESLNRDNFKFSTKYTLLRLYDFAPHDIRTQILNETGLNFQYLLIKTLKAKGLSHDQIDAAYDKITAQDFVDIAQKHPTELKQVLKRTCQFELTSNDACNSIERAFENVSTSKPPSETTIKSLQSLGYHYFDGLFKESLKIAASLDPEDTARP